MLFHTDAAQAIGKIPFDATQYDLVTVVGHKMYAPKGIGALCIRPGVALEPLVYGGGQEHGLRAGAENVALAVALGTAAELAAKDLASGGHDRIRALRDRLHHLLVTALPGRVRLNGPERRRPRSDASCGLVNPVSTTERCRARAFHDAGEHELWRLPRQPVEG